MNLQEIFNALEIKLNIPDTKIKRIVTDSRIIKKGDVFIALKGKKYNGNFYALDALKKGALISIVDDDIKNNRCIKVKNTFNSMIKIANYLRNKYKTPLIAVTGSNGKTTTKELIVHILKHKYNVLYNKDNNNNIIGISKTLFECNKNTDIVVLELGSNHIGEIQELSNTCNPTTSIITNIGSSHLGNFRSKKNIFKEKKSIISGMKEENLIVNGDDTYLKKLNCFKCGLINTNDLVAYNVREKINSTTFSIKLDKEYEVVLNIPGKHFINDALLAIKACLSYVDIHTIIKRLSSFKLLNKRMNIKKIKSNVIINDCYNSSIESLTSGLEYLNIIKSNKVIILGDILELGRYSKSIHKKINKLIKEDIKVLTVGKYTKYIKGIHFDSINALLNYLENNQITNSYIYIKGSRRTGLDSVVQYFEKR